MQNDFINTFCGIRSLARARFVEANTSVAWFHMSSHCVYRASAWILVWWGHLQPAVSQAVAPSRMWWNHQRWFRFLNLLERVSLKILWSSTNPHSSASGHAMLERTQVRKPRMIQIGRHVSAAERIRHASDSQRLYIYVCIYIYIYICV